MGLGSQDELAACVTLEQGKTLPDAHGDVFRGLGALLALQVDRLYARMLSADVQALQAGKVPVCSQLCRM